MKRIFFTKNNLFNKEVTSLKEVIIENKSEKHAIIYNSTNRYNIL